jgi:hypothetical protein
MAGNDKDRGRSRSPSAEDRGCSKIGQVLTSQMIDRSNDVVCSLHRAQGDKARRFLGLASKPRLMVSPGLASKPNEDINTSAAIIPSIEILGPITRSRAQQLNHEVNSFLCSSAYNIESRLLPNDLIVLRNQGEDYGG